MHLRTLFLVVSLNFCYHFLFAQSQDYYDGEVLIKLSKNYSPAHLTESVNADLPDFNFTLKEVVVKSLGIYLFEFRPDIPVEECIAMLHSNPMIATIQANHNNIELRVDSVPNDANYSLQWNMDKIKAPAAWSKTIGGRTFYQDEIVVAVIDNGFALNHPDLNFFENTLEIPGNGIDDDDNGYVDDVNGWNGYNSNGTITASHHGTHVSGIVGAIGNNSIGVAGVNWDVKILAIQGSSTNEATLLRGYGYAYDMRRIYNETNGEKGAYIVATNSSFGVNRGKIANYPLWCEFYDTFGSVGILSAGATANSNINVDIDEDMPTACPSDYLISVTNTNQADNKHNGAAYGQTTIDIGAPGVQIYSCTHNNLSYSYSTGTSMSTPHVAGAVAFMYSALSQDMLFNYKNKPDELALKVREFMLTEGFDSIPSLKTLTVTGGRLNLDKCLKAISKYDSLRISTNEIFISENNIDYYPNPITNKSLTISNSANESVILELFDLTGKKVFMERLNFESNNQIQLQLSSNINPGMYVIRFSKNEQILSNKKLIIR